MFELETKWGKIRFSKNVIVRICTEAVRSTDGKAAILNFKGRHKTRPDLFNAPREIRPDSGDLIVEETEEGLVITMYLVLRFGASINGTVEHIIDRIYEQVESVMGEPPAKVNVTVTGTASRDIARRHIEFSR